MNEKIIKEFEKLIAYRRSLKEKNVEFKINAFQKVIDVLKNFDHEITSSKELDGYRGIGDKSKKYIEEVIKNGFISESKNFEYKATSFNRSASKEDSLTQKNQDEIATIKKFTDILGVGVVTARRWYEEGYRDLSEIRKLKTLTATQKLGIEYYNDLNKRIPYEEIQIYDNIFKKIEECLNKYIKQKMSITIAGSYRRGNKDSHDIDVVFTSEKLASSSANEIKTSKIYREFFINVLKFKKLVVADVSEGDTKHLILVKLKGYPVRHMDIEFTDQESYPFAVLYFTGSKNFNVAMRGFAKSKGYLLNHEGLYYREEKTKVKKKFRNEKEIFEYLNYPYQEPKDRV